MADDHGYEDGTRSFRKPIMVAAIAIPIILVFGYFAFVKPGRVGAGGFKVANTVPVQGTVLWKGKALAGILVTYHPQFQSGVRFNPNGTTNAEGKYTLSSAVPGDGAPPGEYVVTFEFPFIPPSAPSEVEVDLFKGKYSDPAKSNFKVNVAKDTSETFKLD